MTALVTGASGLMGRHLVRRLLGDGVPVRALVRSTDAAAPLLAAGVEVATGDLASAAPLDELVAGCDVVFHLAAAHGAGATPALCEAVNVRGTERLAAAAARAGTRRFVFASSRGVHGLIQGGVISEHTPLAPNTPYRSSKVRAERVLARLGAEHGLRWATLRLPSTLGEGSRTWIALFRAVAGGRFRLIGSGANRHHPCHVQDAAAALALAADAPGIDGETFVIGGAAPLSVREFIQYIADEVGGRVARPSIPAAAYRPLAAIRDALVRAAGRPVRADAGEFWLSSYEIDDARARSRLGYAPAGSLRDAIAQTADWYRSSGVLR